MRLDLLNLLAAQKYNLVLGREGETVGATELGLVLDGGGLGGGELVDGELELIDDGGEGLVGILGDTVSRGLDPSVES